MWYKADAAPLSPKITAGAAPVAAPSRRANRTAGTTARLESTRRQNCSGMGVEGMTVKTKQQQQQERQRNMTSRLATVLTRPEWRLSGQPHQNSDEGGNSGLVAAVEVSTFHFHGLL